MLNCFTIPGPISKLYTHKQQKEFLRKWTAIGQAYISINYSQDLFQILDTASSSILAELYCPSAAAGTGEESTSCSLSWTAVISVSKPGLASTFVFSSSGILFDHISGRFDSTTLVLLGYTLLVDFASAISTPSTKNILPYPKADLDTTSSYNTTSTLV